MSVAVPLDSNEKGVKMYLNVGKNTLIPKNDIVAVMDLDNSSTSHITRAFLTAAEKSGRVINACDDLPKSFILCKDKDGKEIVYLSQLASSTLLKRADYMGFE